MLDRFLSTIKHNAKNRETAYAKNGEDKEFMTAKEVHVIHDVSNGKDYSVGNGFYQTSDGRIWTDTDGNGELDLEITSSNDSMWADRDANGSFETNVKAVWNPLTMENL